MNTLPEEILRIIYKKVYLYTMKEMKDNFYRKGQRFECYNCGSGYIKKDNSDSYIIHCSQYCEREYYGFNRFE